MSRSRTRSSKKKTVTIAVLVACLLLAAIGGTIAWLTVRDSLINQFTVGDFNDPTKDDQGDVLPEEDGKKLQGHLYEENWDAENAKLVPSGTVAKDPNVGIGPDSEDAFVYLFVNNTAKNNSVYFKLNEGWAPVDMTGITVEKTDVKEGYPGHEQNAKYYTGGLFVYVGTESSATPLSLAEGKDNAWTGTLFDEVYVDPNAKKADLVDETSNAVCKVEVTALLHQANDGEADQEGTLASTATTWAMAQANKLASGLQSAGSDAGLE